MLELAAQHGQPAIAITDHGNMHGAVQFYDAAMKTGIKPIIGCELYVTPGSRFDKRTRAMGGAGTHHLTVLARDMEGYHNLCRLVTLAYKEGFYFKPRVDHELLTQYSKGLVALSGCLASEMGGLAEREQIEEATELAKFYDSIFPDRYYLEVQPHQITEQRRLNNLCAEVAKQVGIPLVATTDCHYSSADDHYAQEVLMCVSTGKLITDPDRIQHKGVDLHLKTRTEMVDEFRGWKGTEEALDNTLRIAEQCNIEFDFSTYYMPKFDENEKRELIDVMSEQAWSGLEERIEERKQRGEPWSDELRVAYDERLNEEIDLIDKMGFAGYFLVVSDFIVWAKQQNIPVGPGRGSAAGSLVAFVLRITDLDPIEHKLLFERFLNPERVSLPDIDVDFCIYGRDQVIKYVVEKYGADKVAQIATFGTLKAKAAIKDVGRALGLSYAETDRVAQLVPAPRQGFDYPIAEALKMEPKLKSYADGEGQELITLAMKIEGLNRHTSTHAAGVVIGDRPLTDLLPLMVDKDGNDVTQYSMKYVEKIGLVKFDFLGLKTLTVIHEALRLIKESQDVDIHLEKLSLDDPETYELLCAGNTTGVFQLESSGITEMTMRLKPNSFDDLVAILALYRPGPLDAGMVDHYIERKHGRQQVEYLHTLMQDILADTYGIILYQEQIMQLARTLAGYSLAEADLLRRAMGKKIPEEMAKQRDRFLTGAKEKEIEKKAAEEIFSQMETFARYGFNRSHSAAYALISFQTAYLKAHYPVEFMAALMSNEMGDSDKTLKNLNECRNNSLAVLPPDVNESQSGFSVNGAQIRYGLSAVKGIGEKAVIAIIEAREEDGPFVDLEDFAIRVDLKAVNKRVVESLIKCGAFDFSGDSRRGMLERYEEVLRAAVNIQKERDSNQITLFSAGGGEGANDAPSIPKRNNDVPEWTINKKLAFEREALGFYITGHPLSKYQQVIKSLGAISTLEARKMPDKSQVKIGGVITALKLKNTKRGDRYASFIFEDSHSTLEALAWPDVYRKIAGLMVADDPVIAQGRLDVREERASFIVENLESLLDFRDKNAKQGIITLTEEDPLEQHMDKLIETFDRNSGDCPIKLRLVLQGEQISMDLRDAEKRPICVNISEELCDEVEQLFGKPVLSFH